MTLQLASITKESFVDGPGIRFVVFVQGCPHNCPGCHNPETHHFEGGWEAKPEEIIKDIEKNPYLDGVTFSGGEPFTQAGTLAILAKMLQKRSINLWVYTGYTIEQLLKKGEKDYKILDLLTNIDVLVDGPFILEQRSLKKPFAGSKNQRLIDIKKTIDSNKLVLWEPEIW